MSSTKNKSEEEYFAREEAEKMHRRAEERRKEISADDEKAAKDLHYMSCPKCGHDLQEVTWRSVKVDKCYSCKGVFLDDGELEKLAGEEHNTTFVRDFINIFKMK
ncbi:MAG: zf-TFIIB domain-containing protein [Deltaproteobacteria bacterium]|nr:zf-TFIIB domain-containing protein [Deltaproteobacteria bacterium]